MRFGSVCSGIEAASVAWHDLGWQAAWLSEVDVAASAVLAARYGATAPQFPVQGTEKSLNRIEWGDQIVNWGDMTRLPELIENGHAEAPDIFCGGAPCQSYSIAGLRKGLSDERGNLTLAFVDIADTIDRKRAENAKPPCIIFYENVPGILSSKDNAFGCFLAGLAGEDTPLEPPGKRWTDAGVVLGPQRAIAWVIKDAQYFGLAQRRRRVFVVASAREGFDPAAVLFEFEGVRRDTAPSREAGESVAGTAQSCASSSNSEGRSGRPVGLSHWDDPQNPHPTLNQSFNTGGIGQSNQELFSQRGCGLVSEHTHTAYQDVSHCLNAGGMGRIDYETESFVIVGPQK